MAQNNPNIVLQGFGGRTIPGSSLVIPEIKQNDGGLYTCTAKSTEGHSTDSISVTVMCKYSFVFKLNKIVHLCK